MRDPLAWLERYLTTDPTVSSDAEALKLARHLTSDELEALYRHEMLASGYFTDGADGITIDRNPATQTVTLTCHRCGRATILTMQTPLEVIERFEAEHLPCQAREEGA